MIEVLIFGLSTNRGGIESYLKKIWDTIDHSRFHFNFIDMTGDGRLPQFYEELTGSGCRFFKITPRSVSMRKNRRDVVDLFQSHHFDIFHFNVNTLSYLVPVEAALNSGCKVLVHSRSSGSSRKRTTRFFHELNKKRLQKLDVTRIAVSQKAGEWLFGDSDFAVYPNGIQTEKFRFFPEQRARIREALDCTGKTVIANVGTFVEAKNHTFMIHAFEEYKKQNENAVLWLIGDGHLRPSIEQLVREKKLENSVLFLGVRKDMQQLYAGMDLFWFPSLFEGYGNVVLEAECEGVPCLLSDCIPQDTRVMDNTFSFSLDRPLTEWADKIAEAVSAQKPDRTVCWQEMADKGLSSEAEIARLEALYQNMLGR